MTATDPIVTFVLILVIGIVAGILFDRLAGPSWLARSVRRIDPRNHHECAGGYRRRVRRLSRRCAACGRRRAGDVRHCGGRWCCCGAVRLAAGQVMVDVKPKKDPKILPHISTSRTMLFTM